MCDQYRLPTGAGRSLHPLAAKRLADRHIVSVGLIIPELCRQSDTGSGVGLGLEMIVQVRGRAVAAVPADTDRLSALYPVAGTDPHGASPNMGQDRVLAIAVIDDH